MATLSIPKHNVLLTIGDFNAHISENNKCRYTYHNSTNSNEKLVIDYTEKTNMLLIKTNFRKRVGKLWTFMSDSNIQIPYWLRPPNHNSNNTPRPKSQHKTK